MALDPVITTDYALYHGDCMALLQRLPAASVDFVLYSPPFATATGALYTYSSDEHDLSNSFDKEEFFTHYAFIIQALGRVTKPGRMHAVHCMDIPTGNTGIDGLYDFPGDIIRHYEAAGWTWTGRHHVWKEPLVVRNRTMAKGLTHKTIVEDATRCSLATADQLLIFRHAGTNAVPVAHPEGLTEYYGARPIPAEVQAYRGWVGPQIENKYSHWIWQQYASAFWDDVRLDRVLPYQAARDAEDERHIHPLQLDVIERAITLWTNPGETVLSPFMGIGSEVYGAVRLGRRGIGIDLKETYVRQAQKNVPLALAHREYQQIPLFR